MANNPSSHITKEQLETFWERSPLDYHLGIRWEHWQLPPSSHSFASRTQETGKSSLAPGEKDRSSFSLIRLSFSKAYALERR